MVGSEIDIPAKQKTKLGNHSKQLKLKSAVEHSSFKYL